MKKFILFTILLFSFLKLYSQNKTYLKFSKAERLDEFIVEVFLNIPDSFSLDVDNSYLSFVDNNFDSIDCGEYKIIKFANSNMPLIANFITKKSNPPKFVKLQSVFRNKYYKNIYFTKTEYCKVILQNNFSVLQKVDSRNIFFIYFNDSNHRSVFLYDLLSKIIAIYPNIISGDEIDVGSRSQGIYFLCIDNFGTKKVLIR